MILRPSAPRPERSLAAVPAGSRAEIRSIVFGGIRQALAEAGVHEGDLVVCRPGAGSRVQIENDSGELIEIAQSWARFIEVEAPGSADFQTDGVGGRRPVGPGRAARGKSPPALADRSVAPVYPFRSRGGGQGAKWSERGGEITPPETAT